MNVEHHASLFGVSNHASPPHATKKKDLVIDIALLKRVLDVNPGFAQGRSIMELKQALEEGGSQRTQVDTAQGHKAVSATQGLRASLQCFVSGHHCELEQDLSDIQKRRDTLRQEEEALKRRVFDALLLCLSSLHPRVSAGLTATTLHEHRDFLKALGMSPKDVLAALSGRRSTNKFTQKNLGVNQCF
jgi:hypothetical protein